jgi:immunity protein 27 of polymorphic toxin system
MLSNDGKWVVDGTTCQLIQHLIGNHFIHVDQRGDGWTKRYQDPQDGSYWELTYPPSAGQARRCLEEIAPSAGNTPVDSPQSVFTPWQPEQSLSYSGALKDKRR